MFGSRQGSAEEWSTEDEADIDDLDDDDDDDEYGSDDDNNNTTWEPPARHYSQMNLKEETNKERQSKITEEYEKVLEARRKLKNAKKRAEKRRKQKEKKLREAAVKEAEEDQLRQIEETKKQEVVDAASKAENITRWSHLYAPPSVTSSDNADNFMIVWKIRIFIYFNYIQLIYFSSFLPFFLSYDNSQIAIGR